MERSDMGAALVKAILGKSPERTLVKIAHPDEFTSTAVNSKQVPIPGPETFDQARCLSWVKSGSVAACTACPFYPQEQTSYGRPRMSVNCSNRTHAPPQ